MKEKKLTRRDFVTAAAGVAAFTIVPRSVLGGAGQTPPSEKVNIAGVGVGGQGASDLRELEKQTEYRGPVRRGLAARVRVFQTVS